MPHSKNNHQLYFVIHFDGLSHLSSTPLQPPHSHCSPMYYPSSLSSPLIVFLGGHVFHDECIQLLNNSIHRKIKAQCPLCRVSIQSIIPLFLNNTTTQISHQTTSQLQHDHRDTLIELNALLSERMVELEQAQTRIQALQSEHTLMVDELNKKHALSMKMAEKNYEKVVCASRDLDEKMHHSERLNKKLEKEVEAVRMEMEDFKALRVCTMVQSMLKDWNDEVVHEKLCKEKDLNSLARALCLQNRIQWEEMKNLQTSLSQLRIEKQELERKILRQHSDMSKTQRDPLEMSAKSTPSEVPIIRDMLNHSSVKMEESTRTSIKTGSLFKTKGRTRVDGTVPDGMGGRSKIMKRSNDQIIEL